MTTTDAHREQARRALLAAGTKPDRVEPMLRYVDLEHLPRTAAGELEPAALTAAAGAAAAAVPELTRAGRQPHGAQPPAGGGSTGSSDPVAEVLAQMRAAVGLPTPPTA